MEASGKVTKLWISTMFSGEQAIVLHVTCVVHDFRVAILFLNHANRPEYNQLALHLCTMADVGIPTALFVHRADHGPAE